MAFVRLSSNRSSARAFPKASITLLCYRNSIICQAGVSRFFSRFWNGLAVQRVFCGRCSDVVFERHPSARESTVPAPAVKMLFLRTAIVLTCSLVALLDSAAPADANDRISKLSKAVMENRTRLHFDGKAFTGPAWEKLLAEARNVQFFLIGEEHGIAENPKLAAQLFVVLADEGYEKLVIEISPPIAQSLDRTLTNDGLAGLQGLYELAGGEPVFFGMREEAELLSAARAALPDAHEVLWGIDYEVASDRRLLHQL